VDGFISDTKILTNLATKDLQANVFYTDLPFRFLPETL